MNKYSSITPARFEMRPSHKMAPSRERVFLVTVTFFCLNKALSQIMDPLASRWSLTKYFS
jgi:hypothetical protein